MAKKRPEPAPPPPPPSPPEGLSERALALWHDVVPRRGISKERLCLLTEALRALDRAESARRLVDEQGLTTTTGRSGVTHVHPAVKVERESRQQFAKIWVDLGLQSASHDPSKYQITQWP